MWKKQQCTSAWKTKWCYIFLIFQTPKTLNFAFQMRKKNINDKSRKTNFFGWVWGGIIWGRAKFSPTKISFCDLFFSHLKSKIWCFLRLKWEKTILALLRGHHVKQGIPDSWSEMKKLRGIVMFDGNLFIFEKKCLKKLRNLLYLENVSEKIFCFEN